LKVCFLNEIPLQTSGKQILIKLFFL